MVVKFVRVIKTYNFVNKVMIQGHQTSKITIILTSNIIASLRNVSSVWKTVRLSMKATV